MPRFRERVENHGLQKELQALDESLDSVDFAMENEQHREDYDRFRRVIEHVRQRISQADPELVTENMLNSLMKQVSSVRGQVDQFKQTKDPSALNAHADNLLSVLHQWPEPTDTGAEFAAIVEEVRSRANDIIEKVGKHAAAKHEAVEKLGSDVGDLETRLKQHNEQFEQQKGRIDQIIADVQAKFTDAQHQRLNEFNEAERQRKAFVEELVETKGAELDELIEKRRAESAAQDQQIADTATKQLDALQGHLDHAKKIVGLIGNTGMTGHYQKVANRELWASEILRGIAIAFFVLMAVAVGWVVKDIGSDDFSWEVALFRVGVSLTALAPAVYCARESTRHRRHENRNRRIELELASIKPFLGDLPEEKTQQVIEQMASRYFGKEIVEEPGRGSRKDSPSDLVNEIERLAKIFRH